MSSPAPGDVWILTSASPGAAAPDAPLGVIIEARWGGRWLISPVFDEGLLVTDCDLRLPVGPASPLGEAWCTGDVRQVVPRRQLARRVDRVPDPLLSRLRTPRAPGDTWAVIGDPRPAARAARFQQTSGRRVPWAMALAAALALGALALRLWPTDAPTDILARGAEPSVGVRLRGGTLGPLDAHHRAGDRVTFRHEVDHGRIMALWLGPQGELVPLVAEGGVSAQARRPTADGLWPQAWPLTVEPASHRILIIRSTAPLSVVGVTALLQAWPLPWVVGVLRGRGYAVDQVLIPGWERP